MLTATKDLMLPATVTGSWPRPRWYDKGLWGRPLDTALLDVHFREQFLDAHSTVIADQERAGLDIVTNGDYHLDEDFAGRSWHHYPLQRWTGLEHEELQYERSRDRLLEFPAGTLMNEIETTWRWPRVVGKVEHDPKNPLEYAKLWRIAQARAGKPVKFGTCSSQVLAIFLDSHTAEYDLDDKKQLIWDMATAMNKELRQLAAAGVVSHRQLQADMAPVVAGRIRRALEVIPADKLIVSSDCGFGRQGFNRTVAFYKATGIAQGRNVVLKELGLEPRYIAAADASLQTDVLPDFEPITHLRSPRA